jgi:F-type H+-transporting ATPase subunit gamma
MEMVAAARMRRAQSAVTAGRPYSSRIEDVIQNIAARIKGNEQDDTHPLLQRRPVKNVAVIMITSDNGLAGALNTNIIRRTSRFILQETGGAEAGIIAVGRKGRDFMVRYGRRLIAEFVNISDRPSLADSYPIAQVAVDEFINGRADAVYLVYTDFVNTLIQRPTVFQLLPIDIDEVVGSGDEKNNLREYIYEPGPREVLAQILPRYIEVRIYQALLEHQASEQSARMVAMRNAKENSKELISDLTLAYNKLRQANITKEIIEISSGASALSG